MTLSVLTSLVLRASVVWASVVWASVALASDHTYDREVYQLPKKLLNREEYLSMPSIEKQLSTSPLKQLRNNDIHDTDHLVTAKRQTPETDLYAWMTEMHKMSDLMHQLHQSDRTTLIDLMYAVQRGQLTQYIKSIGYRAVFVILSHINRHESLELEHILEKHLQKEAALAKANAASTKPTVQPATRTTLKLTTITTQPAKTTTKTERKTTIKP